MDFTIIKFYGHYDKTYVFNISDRNIKADILEMDRYIDGVLIKSLCVGSYPGIVCMVMD